MAGKFWKKSLCFIVFSSLVITEVLSVPMSQSCPETQTLRQDPHSHLNIKCGSSCDSGKFEWYKKKRGEVEQTAIKLDLQDSTLSVPSVDYSDGGMYICQCVPLGPKCEQDVYVNPTMEFTTNMKYVYTGDDVELACTVHSMDPNYPTISLKDSSSLSSHDTRRKQLDSYTVRTELWIHEQFGQKTDYVCVAERDERDEMSERIEQELSIYSYEPPEIVYTTEFNIDGDLGRPGRLLCSVLASPDTESWVTWLFRGEEVVLGTGKYHTTIQNTDKRDVLQYVLTVENVQEEDLGPYTCQLHSTFNSNEGEHEVWIKSDDRESAAPNDNSNDNSHKKERGGYGKTYILLCMVGVAAVFLLWKCAVHKRKSSKRGVGLSDSLPTNGYSYPQNSLDWDRGGSATRRKQVW